MKNNETNVDNAIDNLSLSGDEGRTAAWGGGTLVTVLVVVLLLILIF